MFAEMRTAMHADAADPMGPVAAARALAPLIHDCRDEIEAGRRLPARLLAFIGHQWMLRNNVEEALRNLDASLAKGLTDEARIDLARVDALSGKLDACGSNTRRLGA